MLACWRGGGTLRAGGADLTLLVNDCNTSAVSLLTKEFNTNSYHTIVLTVLHAGGADQHLQPKAAPAGRQCLT